MNPLRASPSRRRLSSGTSNGNMISVGALPREPQGSELQTMVTGADLGGGCRGCAPSPGMTRGFLMQLVFCKKKKTMWFIGVEVEQETSAPPPKKIL